MRFRSLRRGDMARYSLPLAAVALAAPLHAQFETTLQPKTRDDYQQYVNRVQADLEQRWQGKGGSPLVLDDRPADKAKVMKGELVVREAAPAHAAHVEDGMVHDWVGAMFLPGAKIPDVLNTLGDWNNQKRYYPEVIDSRLVSRNGNMSTGFWRLKRTKFVTVVLDVDLASKQETLPSGLATVTTHTKRISEVVDAGQAAERILPPGTGHGYLWAFDAFWTLRQEADGVYAECRTISLSRTIPGALAWMVGPLVQSMPKESLLSTLRGTKQASFPRGQ